MKLKVYHAQLRTLPAKRPSGVLASSGVVLKITGIGDRRMYFSGSNDDSNYAYIGIIIRLLIYHLVSTMWCGAI